MAIRRMGSYIDLTPAKESYEDTVKDIDSMISGFVLGIESMEAALTLSEVSTEDMSVRERKSYNLALEHIGRSVNIKPALEAEEDEDGETGVWAFIKRIWRKVCDTFASIWEKITNLFTDVDDRVKKADEKVEKKVEKLEEAIKTIDEPAKETKDEGGEPKPSLDPKHHDDKVNFIADKDGKITKDSVEKALANLEALNKFLRDGFPKAVKASVSELKTSVGKISKTIEDFTPTDRANHTDTREDVNSDELRTEVLNFLNTVVTKSKKAIGTNGTESSLFGTIAEVNVPVSDTTMVTYDEYKTTHSIGVDRVTRLVIRLPHLEENDASDLGHLCNLQAFPSVRREEEDKGRVDIDMHGFFLSDKKKLEDIVNTLVSRVKNHTKSNSDVNLKALCSETHNSCKETEVIITKLLDAKRADSNTVKPMLNFIKKSLSGAMQDLTVVETMAELPPKLMMHVVKYLDACVVYSKAKV